MDSEDQWIGYELSYNLREEIDGEINLNIPRMCIICGNTNIEGYLKLRDVRFSKRKKYMKIPLCEDHYGKQIRLRILWFLLFLITPVILLALFLSLTLFSNFTEFFIDSLVLLASSLLGIIIIVVKIYKVKYGLNNFIEFVYPNEINDFKLELFIRSKGWVQKFENMNGDRTITEKGNATEDVYLKKGFKVVLFVILFGLLLPLLNTLIYIYENYRFSPILNLIIRSILAVFFPFVFLLLLLYVILMIFYKAKSKKGTT
jgi:hypothetical protein